MTKSLTMIYRHLNYKNAKDSNGKATGKAKLLKSLAHSLRINPNPNNKVSETKKLEWDESKSELNYVYSPLITGDKFVKLSQLTEDEKKQIQESFITKMNDEQTAKDSKSDAIDTLSKYKAKVNKWHNSITDDGDNLKKFLAKILDEKEIFIIEKEINQLSEFDFSRKNQKTETVRKFLELHNEVIENKSDISRNKVFVQEAFFKIPDKNNFRMGTKDMINNIRSFYTENFPDYPIQLIVFHGDEVGDHPHIFVDAQNKKSKKYDLLAAQNRFVNEHIEQVKADYPNAEKLDFSIRSYKTKKLQAQYFQTLFYQHTNKILASKNVQVKKLEKTDEHNARMALIEEDSKKPKIERQFSFYNAQLNEAQAQNEALIKRNSSLESKNKKLEKEEEDIAKNISNQELKLAIAQQELEALENRVDARTEDLKSLNVAHNELSQSFENLQNRYNAFADSFKEMYQSAQKQMFDSVRNVLSAVWSASAWGKDKFTFSLFSNEMKGAPSDLQEFDERVEEVKKFNSTESIDLYLDMDFLTSNDKIAQKFKEKLREKNTQVTENSRRVFFKNADVVMKELEENDKKLVSQTLTKEQKDKLLKYK